MKASMEIRKEKEKVREMFDRIAPRYDYLNRLLSLGIDRRWRGKAVGRLLAASPTEVLDVATGTGDLALAISGIPDCRVTGLDISPRMLELFAVKAERCGVEERVCQVLGDSEDIPFAADTFDAVTCAFGVRNFEHLDTGLREMFRVLKPGGKVVILEFSLPTRFPVKQLYGFYFRNILPRIGRRISRHEEAYRYLPETVQTFPERTAFTAYLCRAGFQHTSCRPLTGGVVCLYEAGKPDTKQAVL